MTELDFTEIVLQPDDVLILQPHRQMQLADLEQIRAALASVSNGVAGLRDRCLVVDPSFGVTVVRRDSLPPGAGE